MLLARLEERSKTLFDTIHLLQTQTTGFEARLKESVARIEDIADQVQKIMFRQEGPDGSIERLRNLEEITDHVERDVAEVKRQIIHIPMLETRAEAISRRVTTLEEMRKKAAWTTTAVKWAGLFIIGLAAVIGAVEAIITLVQRLRGA